MNDDMVPVPDDLWQEANEYTSRGKFDEAIEIYKYILIRYGANNLANELANAHLGDILLTLGQAELGLFHVKKALSYDPDNPCYHYLLGFVHYIRYEWENAVQEYKLALDKEPWNREYLRSLGEAIFNAGDKKTGLQCLHEVAPLYPDNSGMLTELATAYMALGDLTLAREYAEEAVRTNPTDIMALAVLKKTYVLGTRPGNVTTS